MTTGRTQGAPPNDHMPAELSGRDKSHRHARWTRRQHLRRAALVAAVSLLLIAVSAGWLAFRAQEIKTNVEPTISLVGKLRSELASGEVDTAHSTLNQLREYTARARAAGNDPLWRAAGNLPAVGANFSAVSEMTVSADDVVNLAIAPILEESAATEWESLAPIDGRIDIGPIEQLSPRLSAASNTVHLSYERLSSIDSTKLVSQIAQPLEEATIQLGEASKALHDASAAAKVLPGMLGSERRREYLLLIQNSAEIRATGGIPGALAVLTATDGRIELADQGSATALGAFEPAVDVDPAQISIYSSRMGRFMQSSNLTPDFPTAARTAATMWNIRHEHSALDGVIAVDPVALSYILHATGPVELSFDDPAMNDLLSASGLPRSLTAENVVPTLLSDVYKAIEEPRMQDGYFAAVASEIFEALSSGTGGDAELIQALTQSAQESRLNVWSADSGEQAIIASSALAGGVTGPGSGGAAFGAYFNDGTGAKMDYYVRRTVQLQGSCTPGGYLQYTLTATLTNAAPLDAAKSLPAYVTGNGAFGVPAGTVQTNFIGYGPDQSQLQTGRMDGKQVALGSYRHADRPVGVLTTSLAPGQTATVELDFTKVVQTSKPVLDVTPTIQPTNEVVLPVQGETACG